MGGDDFDGLSLGAKARLTDSLSVSLAFADAWSDAFLIAPLATVEIEATRLSLGAEYELSSVKKLEKKGTLHGQQRRLSQLGYELGAIDGVMGIRTGRAALQFQADNAPLDTDGKIGSKTTQQLVVQAGE